MDQPGTLLSLLVSVFTDFYQGLYHMIEGIIIVIEYDQTLGIIFILIFQYIYSFFFLVLQTHKT